MSIIDILTRSISGYIFLIPVILILNLLDYLTEAEIFNKKWK